MNVTLRKKNIQKQQQALALKEISKEQKYRNRVTNDSK